MNPVEPLEARDVVTALRARGLTFILRGDPSSDRVSVSVKPWTLLTVEEETWLHEHREEIKAWLRAESRGSQHAEPEAQVAEASALSVVDPEPKATQDEDLSRPEERARTREAVAEVKALLSAAEHLDPEPSAQPEKPQPSEPTAPQPAQAAVIAADTSVVKARETREASALSVLDPEPTPPQVHPRDYAALGIYRRNGVLTHDLGDQYAQDILNGRVTEAEARRVVFGRDEQLDQLGSQRRTRS